MKTVTIVGGGLSGLTVAYELSKNPEFEITLLEASDRLGGRVRSVKVDGVEIDVGGFIIFKWYKHFRSLLKELNLEQELKYFQPIEGYWLIGKKLKRFNSNIFSKKISLFKYLKLLISVIPTVLTYQKNFYLPSGRDESVSKILKSVFVRKNSLFRYINTFFTGYTYPEMSSVAFFSAVSVLEMMLFKGGMESAQNLNPTTKLIDVLIKKLLSKNVLIRLNTRVTSYKKGLVQLDSGELLNTDIVVVATPHISNFIKQTRVENISATKYYSIILELNEEFKVNNSEWDGIFGEPLGKSYEVSSVVNLNWLTYGQLSKKHILVYLKSEKNVLIDDIRLKIILNNQLARYFPGSSVKKIHSVNFFKENMPIISVKDVRKIRDMQGLENIYYTGDYLSFPSMETAVYNGKKVAEMIISA